MSSCKLLNLRGSGNAGIYTLQSEVEVAWDLQGEAGPCPAQSERCQVAAVRILPRDHEPVGGQPALLLQFYRDVFVCGSLCLSDLGFF